MTIANSTRNGTLPHTRKNGKRTTSPDGSRPLSVAFVSTAIPRQCGIATFTADLVAAVRAADPSTRTSIVAIDEPDSTRQYGPEVRLRIRQGDPDSYRAAALALNHTHIDVVHIQHEFGLYGRWIDGEFEDHLVPFLEAIRKPVVTTLHTVPVECHSSVKEAIRAIARHSRALIVMASLAAWLLKHEYGVGDTPIEIVPHGVPSINGRGSRRLKERLGLKGKKVISTFGLLDPRKGLEYMIRAMPTILSRYPDTVYLIVGRTHPELVRREGEKYRAELVQLQQSLGLEKNVIFINEYLTQRQIVDYLLATDIYVTPYLDPNQITSGTLAYALGAGKAIISTPYLHAVEALGEQRGILVDFRDSWALARSVLAILDDADLKARLEQNAYQWGRDTSWPRVGRKHLEYMRWVTGLGAKPEPPAETEGIPVVQPRRDENGVRHLRLANLTRHDQSPYRARYAAQKYDVDADPAGVVAPVLADPEEVREIAYRTVDALVARGYDGAVIGGRADVVCYLREALYAAGLRCFSVDTRRSLTRDRVVESAPLGLIEILPPKSQPPVSERSLRARQLTGTVAGD